MNVGKTLVGLVDRFAAGYTPLSDERNTRYYDGYATAMRELRARFDAGEQIDPLEVPRLYQEADAHITIAYARLTAAYAAARLGDFGTARDLQKMATATLRRCDHPVHVVVTGAFETRLERALAGQPLESELLVDVNAQLTKLAPMDRYHVDRARQHLGILHPHGGLDPIADFVHKKEPALVLVEPAPRNRAASLRAAWAAPSKESHEYQWLVAVTLTLVPSLERDDAHEFLAVVLAELESPSTPAELRLRGLGWALRTACWTDDLELALRAVDGFVEALRSCTDRLWYRESIGVLLHEVAKLGMLDECTRILDAFAIARDRIEVPSGLAPDSCTPAEWGSKITHVCLRLEASTFRARIGQDGELHRETIEAGFDAFAGEAHDKIFFDDRTMLTRTLARALCHTSVAEALSGFERLVDHASNVFDTFHTSSYLALPPLAILESVALAYVELGRSAN